MQTHADNNLKTNKNYTNNINIDSKLFLNLNLNVMLLYYIYYKSY